MRTHELLISMWEVAADLQNECSVNSPMIISYMAQQSVCEAILKAQWGITRRPYKSDVDGHEEVTWGKTLSDHVQDTWTPVFLLSDRDLGR